MLNLTYDCLFLIVRVYKYVFFSGMFHLYRSAHSFNLRSGSCCHSLVVVVIVVVVANFRDPARA